MKHDPFHVREYWEQQGEPEPPRTPVQGGSRYQRFHPGDVVRLPFDLAGMPPAGVYTVRAVFCDPIPNQWPGNSPGGVGHARYEFEGQDLPAYDHQLERVQPAGPGLSLDSEVTS